MTYDILPNDELENICFDYVGKGFDFNPLREFVKIYIYIKVLSLNPMMISII